MANLNQLKTEYLTAKQEYYLSGSTSLSDQEFDALEDKIRALAPDWEGLKKTRVKIGKKKDAPYAGFMPSLLKLKAEDQGSVKKWVKRFGDDSEFLVMPKYDGSSMQAIYREGELSQLITGGDSTTGKDVSYFIPHLTEDQLPKTTLSKALTAVRLEAIMSSEVFTKKYADDFDSARALCSSVFNRQDVSKALKDMSFIALEYVNSGWSILDQMEHLSGIGFDTPFPTKLFSQSNLDDPDYNSSLVELHAKFVKKVPYPLDGLVIFKNEQGLSATEDAPTYARAFKVNALESAPTTTIKSIVWKVSAFGKLVPKAVLSPIKFDGVTVKHAALHNAKWAIERGAGPGAVVKVIRSGEIIPKIIEVTTKAKFPLPSRKEFGEYSWDETETSLVLDDLDSNSDVAVRTLSRFFHKLDLDGMSDALAENLVANGYTSTEEVLTMVNPEHWKALPGIKTSASKYANNIGLVHSGEFDVTLLMAASGCFDLGIGETRLRSLPNKFLAKDVSFTPQELTDSVSGIGLTTANLYLKGYKEFSKWMTATRLAWKLPSKGNSVSGPLSGRAFSWTGYRSPEEEAQITSLGGSILPFGSKTEVLFFRPEGKSSSKVEKAGDRAKQFKAFIKGVVLYTKVLK